MILNVFVKSCHRKISCKKKCRGELCCGLPRESRSGQPIAGEPPLCSSKTNYQLQMIYVFLHPPPPPNQWIPWFQYKLWYPNKPEWWTCCTPTQHRVTWHLPALGVRWLDLTQLSCPVDKTHIHTNIFTLHTNTKSIHPSTNLSTHMRTHVRRVELSHL